MTNDVTVKMPIVAVNIMKDSALVTREVTLTDETSGLLSFIIDDLPLLTDASSIRVELNGAKLSQFSTVLTTTKKVDENDSQWTELKNRLAAVEGELAWQQERIKSLMNGSLNLDCEHTGLVANWLELTAVKGKLAAEHELEVKRLKAEKEELELAQKALVNNQKREKAKIQRQVRVTVVEPLTTGVKVRLSYFIKGALWQPTYALRLAADRQSAKLEIYANIAQLTGENWPAVPLALSLSTIKRQAKLPKLSAWHIGRVKPSATSWRPLPADQADLLADFRQAVISNKDQEQLASIPLNAAAAMAGGTAERVVEDKDACCEEMVTPPEPMMAVSAIQQVPRKPLRGAIMGGMGMMRRESAMACCESVAVMPASQSVSKVASKTTRRDQGLPNEDMFDYSRLQMRAATTEEAGTLQVVSDLAFQGEQMTRDNEVTSWLSSMSRQEESTFLAVYHGHSLEDIPGDGCWHKVPIDSYTLPLDTEYWAIPRQEKTLFRQGTMVNNCGKALLAGPMEVYCDNQLLVCSKLPATPVGGQIYVALGVEDSCKIERHVDHQESQSGILTAQTNYRDTVSISLLSTLPTAIKVNLLDQMPYSYDDNVKISLVEASPAQEKIKGPDGKTLPSGGLGWVLQCQPGQSAEVKFSYNIEIPAKQEVVGGGQRA